MATALIGLLQTLYLLAFKGIDIVHMHGSDSPSSKRKFFYFKFMRLFSCRTIYHFHGASFMEQYPRVSRRWKRRFRQLFEGSDVVICLSDSWRRDILSIAPLAKIIVVPNSITLPVLKENGRKSNVVIRLCFLGLIGERKGLFDLLKVVKMLSKEGYNVLLSIGGNGEVGRLMNEIRVLGIKDVVEYLGGYPQEKGTICSERRTCLSCLPTERVCQ